MQQLVYHAEISILKLKLQEFISLIVEKLANTKIGELLQV